MNLKSQIGAINKHLQDVFDMFGGNSQEYTNELSAIRENLPKNVIDMTARQGANYQGVPDKPLKLSVSKASQNVLNNFESDIKKIRDFEKNVGSALQQAQKYINNLKVQGKQATKNNIRELAQDNYEFSNVSNDWYEELNNSEDLTEEEHEELLDIYSNLNPAYKGSDPEWYEQAKARIRELHDTVENRERRKKLVEKNVKKRMKEIREGAEMTEEEAEIFTTAMELNPDDLLNGF